MFDRYDENLLSNQIIREETNFGGFFEYTYDSQERFNAIIGFRIDSHNLIGTFFTPRAHIRYAMFNNKTIFRFSAGEGRRVSSIFSENQMFLASQRQLIISNPNMPMYGLLPERAWNYGFSLIQKASFFEKEIEFGVDIYRTEFTNRVVVDWESQGSISFYNLAGKSYAQSIQFTAITNLNETLDLRFAYKTYDIKTTYGKNLKSVPLQPKTRWFSSIGYSSKIKLGKQWRADATFHRIGQQRLVSSFKSESKLTTGFSLVSTQLTRQFSNQISVYIGAENLLDVKQLDAVLSSDNPFSTAFDTSQLYAPVFGRMFYGGFRFNL
jgi:outer membrane receptor for ferrienterochelin and colicin